MNDYQVISSSCLLTLVRRVKEEMIDGWQPIGGMCIRSPMQYFHETAYYQTMGRFVEKILMIKSTNKECS